MLSPEVMKKITTLQLHVKKLLTSFFSGDHRSKQKGYGIEFNQLRDYHLGDDIRFIDWKSTARMNKMLVKEYIQEYSKTIMIACDVSASLQYGSSELLKKDIVNQIATILSFAADHCKARVGLLLFSDTVELYIPPALGAGHSAALIKKLWEFVPSKKKTNIAATLQFLAKISKKDTLLFLISDFIESHDFQKELSIVAQRYDLVAVRCLDTLENRFPAVGHLQIYDCETEKTILIKNKKSNALQAFLKQRLELQNALCRKYGIDLVDITVNKPFIDLLVQFFARRYIR